MPNRYCQASRYVCSLTSNIYWINSSWPRLETHLMWNYGPSLLFITVFQLSETAVCLPLPQLAHRPDSSPRHSEDTCPPVALQQLMGAMIATSFVLTMKLLLKPDFSILDSKLVNKAQVVSCFTIYIWLIWTRLTVYWKTQVYRRLV